MHRNNRDIKILGRHCLVIVFVCSLGNCAEVPTYYWVKYGVSEDQIRKDNFFCASMTAQKPSTYAHNSGDWFYYAPLDQPSYRRCMTSRGYQMVSKHELRHGVLPGSPSMLWSQMNKTRALCERVVGEAGDVNSCVRWMSMNPNTNVLPTPASESHESLEPQSVTTSTAQGEMNVCLRHDPNDTNMHRVTINRYCDSNESGSP